MKGKESTKREKIQTVVIAILAIIIVIMGSFFASELKYCNVNKKEVVLEKIDMDGFKTLLNDDSVSIIYLARPGCGFCQQQEPIVKEIISEHELPFFYLNTDTLTEKDFSTIFKLDEKLFGTEGKNFGTPTVLIVKSGKIIGSHIGYMEKTEYEEFLIENGFDL